MDIIIDGIIVNSPNDIKKLRVKLTEDNYFIVREKLKFERSKLINYLKALKKEGLIKSIFRPKNKKMQQHLNEVCLIKSQMKDSIEKIDTIYK